ncbi:MAG TPA: hypothetical protein VHE55_17935 [Fimbriimonadaceae bacterium]|nr:hypothetical protein [Fimbriimonadaceae bacterium]
MKRRGITVLELIVSLVMSVFLVAAATSAYTSAIAFEKHNAAYLEANEARLNLERKIRSLLEGAYVSSSTTDTMTYFLGETSGSTADATTADTLIFTTLSAGLNDNELTSDDDFETMNQTYGPQGGVTEVEFSLTPVGDAGQDKQGLFLRTQTPGDGDPTQGGFEKILDPDVRSIQFQFYNGTGWDPTWGTSGVNLQTTTTTQNNVQTGQDGRRIPAAVQVTYTLASDPDGVTHSFIVQLLHSDVTAENPVAVTGTVGGAQ